MSPTVPPTSVITTSTSSVATRSDAALDLVGDVRDHLHGLAEVVAAALGGEHRLVDRAGGGVGAPRQVLVDEALVVPEVEVGLAAVVGDEHLAVLERVHRARVDVDVRVELLHRDPQAAQLEQPAERGGGEALAERAGHAAGHEDVLRHRGPPSAIGRRMHDGISPYPAAVVGSRIAAIAAAPRRAAGPPRRRRRPESMRAISSTRSSPSTGAPP